MAGVRNESKQETTWSALVKFRSQIKMLNLEKFL